MLVEGCVLVEAKAVTEVLPIHKAQLLSCMKLLDVPIGLLIHFNSLKLTEGVCFLGDAVKLRGRMVTLEGGRQGGFLINFQLALRQRFWLISASDFGEPRRRLDTKSAQTLCRPACASSRFSSCL